MYPGYAIQPPMGPYMPWFPPPTQTPPQNPVEAISTWIKGLEELKKSFKEEKKDEKKKTDTPGVIATALFMMLISPVTGPIIYYFFQLSGSLLHR